MRREIGDFLTPMEMFVYVGRCCECYCQERRFLEEPIGCPDIGAETWREDLVDYGIAEEQVEYIEAGDWELPVVCFRCDHELTYGRDDVYVDRIPIEDYFDCLHVAGSRLPEETKKALFRAYRGSCAGCGASLGVRQTTFDHVLRRADGGWTSIVNIQPLCLGCKKRKDRDEQEHGARESEKISYDFPLRPVPSHHDVAFW